MPDSRPAIRSLSAPQAHFSIGSPPAKTDIFLIDLWYSGPMSPVQQTLNVVTVGLRLRGHPVPEIDVRFGAGSAA